jgi:AcrR family transcriptional regulator
MTATRTENGTPAGDGTPKRTSSPTPRRRPARRGEGAALREEIIEATIGELARTGDAGAISLRGVARAVGIAATSIYLHFASVDDLIHEVKLTLFGRLDAHLRQAAEQSGTEPAARVRARAWAYIRFWQERPGEYAAMFSTQLPIPVPLTPGRVQVSVALDQLGADIAAAWRTPDGNPRQTDEEATLCAVHLWTGLHGMLSLRMIRPHLDWPDLDREVEDLITRLLRPGPSGT